MKKNIPLFLLMAVFISTCFIGCDKLDKKIDRLSGNKAAKDYHKAEKKIKDINAKLKSRYK